MRDALHGVHLREGFQLFHDLGSVGGQLGDVFDLEPGVLQRFRRRRPVHGDAARALGAAGLAVERATAVGSCGSHA